MTPEVVKESVQYIKSIQKDYETAHSLEDALYEQLLKSIANGKCTDPVACAKEALNTKKLKFPRYTA